MRQSSIILSASALMLSGIVIAAVTAPVLAPYGPSEPIHAPFAAPDAQAWLGADGLGRDMLSRILHGIRYTLGIAFIVTILSGVLGVTLAMIAALMRGWIDMLFGRLVDALMSIPQIIFALVVLAVSGVSLTTLILTMAVMEATLFYRITRPVAGDIVSMEYIEVARLRGERLPWYLFREILPNAAPTLIAEFGMRFSFAVLFISALSFLGVGIQPPAADLGGLVRENALAISVGKLAPLIPAFCIAAISLSVNGIVDWFVHRYSIRPELL